MPAKVSIGWAERPREISGLSSALSVSAYFDDPKVKDPSSSCVADRLPTPSGYIQSYTTNLPVIFGSHVLPVRFWSGTEATGRLVGFVNMSAVITPDGTPRRTDGSQMGTIKSSGGVKTVRVVPPESVYVGTSARMGLEVLDSISVFMVVGHEACNASLLAERPGLDDKNPRREGWTWRYVLE